MIYENQQTTCVLNSHIDFYMWLLVLCDTNYLPFSCTHYSESTEVAVTVSCVQQPQSARTLVGSICFYVNYITMYTLKMSVCSAQMTPLFTLNNGWNSKVLSTLNWDFHHKKTSLCFPWFLWWARRPGLWRWMSKCIDSNWHRNTAAPLSSGVLSSSIHPPVHPCFLPVRPTHAHQACGWAQEPPTNPHFPTQRNTLSPLCLPSLPRQRTGCGNRWCVCSCLAASVAGKAWRSAWTFVIHQWVCLLPLFFMALVEWVQ